MTKPQSVRLRALIVYSDRRGSSRIERGAFVGQGRPLFQAAVYSSCRMCAADRGPGPTSPDTGASNGPVEAINGRLEHLRSIALGFCNLTHYILRS
ncbi:hypothetical protein M2251_003167 [Rhodococcus erythropolis]|nr:hypothetical protein [Rhodococcus erythropolis]